MTAYFLHASCGAGARFVGGDVCGLHFSRYGWSIQRTTQRSRIESSYYHRSTCAELNEITIFLLSNNFFFFLCFFRFRDRTRIAHERVDIAMETGRKAIFRIGLLSMCVFVFEWLSMFWRIWFSRMLWRLHIMLIPCFFYGVFFFHSSQGTPALYLLCRHTANVIEN